MSTRRAAFLALVFFACVFAFQPITAQADPIPTITITSGTCNGFWTDNFASGSCSGFDRSNGYAAAIVGGGGARNGVGFYSAYIGSVLQPNILPYYFQLPPVNAEFGSYLSGSVTVGDRTYSVAYGGPAFANISTSASVTVPSGYATTQIPAFFVGGGTACLEIAQQYSCGPPPPLTPTILADVDFGVPGFLTLHFSPAPANFAPNTEFFNATFTSVSEPSSVLLLLIPLASATVWRLRKPLFNRAGR